ncbi:MAG: hypothetical protein ACD_65C00345G0002 [uncultured bacterium]|nr:MAG: hypothetical protein ACD_65C00345G0002 [uncultured bacterium]KKT01814.1 MAG: hypothetical protein UV80_C0008G0024 [Candidatus Peregrinibacteria bacterium GW2011_GWF2_43_17]HAU39492.1 hypothetical protein [Candidatus Peregrinibacteria bacterium]
MPKALQFIAIVLAGITVGIADALIKKASLTESLWTTLKNPLMLIILPLYVAQVLFFIYVFKHQWSVGIAGNVQIVFYSLTVVISGFLIFGEKISPIQGMGMGLALIGVILMNL